MIFAIFMAAFAFAGPAPDPVTVPAAYRNCNKDDDCEAVPLRCGCCQFGAVAKIYATEYFTYANNKGCVDEPCTCKQMTYKPHCVKEACVLGKEKPAPAKTVKKAEPLHRTRAKTTAKKPKKKKTSQKKAVKTPEPQIPQFSN